MSSTILNEICLQVSEFNYLFGVIDYTYYPLNTNVFYYLFNNKDDKFNSNHFWLKSDHTEQDYHPHGRNVLKHTLDKDTPILIYNKIRYFHYHLHK